MPQVILDEDFDESKLNKIKKKLSTYSYGSIYPSDSYTLASTAAIIGYVNMPVESKRVIASIAMDYCGACGDPVTARDKFCMNCGVTLHD